MRTLPKSRTHFWQHRRKCPAPCNLPFIPVHPNQRFHSEDCGNAARVRKHRVRLRKERKKREARGELVKPVTKNQMVADYLQARGRRGATYEAILEYFRRAGVEVSLAYVYRLVYRLGAKVEKEEGGRRMFWREDG